MAIHELVRKLEDEGTELSSCCLPGLKQGLRDVILPNSHHEPMGKGLSHSAYR